MTDLNEAMQVRDKRLRRDILRIVHRARTGPEGGFSLRGVIDMARNSPLLFQDDQHALGLARDLEGYGLIKIEDRRTRKDQRFSIDWLFLRITATGSALVDEQIPVNPLVDDERIG